ncbi:hypothetical protein B0H13DRAFT_1855133 [Mycena leptocephala]|nr:hypothetical protein B0H13DRAFT_1855133 [Mycena leptocephala]
MPSTLPISHGLSSSLSAGPTQSSTYSSEARICPLERVQALDRSVGPGKPTQKIATRTNQRSKRAPRPLTDAGSPPRKLKKRSQPTAKQPKNQHTVPPIPRRARTNAGDQATYILVTVQYRQLHTHRVEFDRSRKGEKDRGGECASRDAVDARSRCRYTLSPTPQRPPNASNPDVNARPPTSAKRVPPTTNASREKSCFCDPSARRIENSLAVFKELVREEMRKHYYLVEG